LVVKRNPDRTREKILQAAFHEIHRQGFRAAAVDRILADTGLTKGALYHHFPNKAALGLAVIDEVVRLWIDETWLRPLDHVEDPVEGLIELLEPGRFAADLGCPLNNLAQEMSALDEEFRDHIAALFDGWRAELARRLDAGREAGFVRRDADCAEVAAFVVAAIEGITGLAKSSRDSGVLGAGAREMRRYLESLRPTA